MIVTLIITILIEGAVAFAYCSWRRQPLLSILITSVIANIITQALLWATLNVFFRHYLPVLLVTEVFIWLFESILLYFPHKNWLTMTNALFLGFCMNLLSFGAGWFLPV